MINAQHDSAVTRNRRSFLSQTALGVGPAALACLLSKSSHARDLNVGVVAPLHHPPRVKRVLHLCMAGGPSHLETFDEKQTLREMHGKPMPESLTKGQQVAQLQGKPLTASPRSSTLQTSVKVVSEFAHCFLTLVPSRTICASFDRCTLTRSITIRHIRFSTRGPRKQAGQAWVRGCFTVLVRSATICRATSY